MKVHLDPSLIGPETDEFERIERASSVAGEKIDRALAQAGQVLRWCYGDSEAWRVIISVPTELELTDFMASGAYADITRKIVELIESVVLLDEGFKLYMEVDSDERVESHEGWFFRLKSTPQSGREIVFDRNGKSLADA